MEIQEKKVGAAAPSAPPLNLPMKMWHSVLLFSFFSHTRLVRVTQHAVRHSFLKNWRLPRLLSLFDLLVK